MNPSHTCRFLPAALLGCSLFATSVAAECQLRLEVDNIDWRGGVRVGYDVFDPGEYAQAVQFRVHLVGDPCPFFVTFSGSSPGESRRRVAFGTDAMTYDIYDSVDRRTILKDLPVANTNEVVRGAFAQGETVKELSYAIVVPPQQVIPAGRYTDLLRITLYEGTPDNFTEKDSRTVTFSVPVEEVTELALVQPGAPFDPHARGQTLDFDRLAKGKAKGFDLRVRSNAGYQILLESEYGGVMKSTDPSVASTIPYSVEVSGGPVNLHDGRQAALARTPRLTDRNGDRHEVAITIGDLTGAIAGTYRDYIMVTVISAD